MSVHVLRDFFFPLEWYPFKLNISSSHVLTKQCDGFYIDRILFFGSSPFPMRLTSFFPCQTVLERRETWIRHPVVVRGGGGGFAVVWFILTCVPRTNTCQPESHPFLRCPKRVASPKERARPPRPLPSAKSKILTANAMKSVSGELLNRLSPASLQLIVHLLRAFVGRSWKTLLGFTLLRGEDREIYPLLRDNHQPHKVNTLDLINCEWMGNRVLLLTEYYYIIYYSV